MNVLVLFIQLRFKMILAWKLDKPGVEVRACTIVETRRAKAVMRIVVDCFSRVSNSAGVTFPSLSDQSAGRKLSKF